jgi:hypothetical protein
MFKVKRKLAGILILALTLVGLAEAAEQFDKRESFT